MSNPITAPKLWWVIARSHHALRLLAERTIATPVCALPFRALERLWFHKGRSQPESRTRVMLASGSMTAAIDRLEKMGLVVRKSTAKDRRARVCNSHRRANL